MLWDDDRHLTHAALRSVAGLWRIWFDLHATQQYYPITHSVFWLEHKLWGGDTLGYHLVNIALHACSAYLFAAILRRLAVPGAVLAALIFALHPAHVESVAWITELKNTSSGVFFLASALMYLRFDHTREPRRYVWALALFVLALLSKTVTAPLPAALLVIIWWQRGTIDRRRDVWPLLPFFAAALAGGLLTTWLERTMIGAQGSEFAFSFVERCLIAGRVITFYFWTLLWPSDLIFNYPRWAISQGVWWQYLYPLAVIALAGALWMLRRRTRAPLAALLLFGGLLFPVLGFFNVYPFRFSFVADHFLYLASLPVIALVAAGWSLPAAAASAGVIALSGLLGLLTFRQSGNYADAETLYRAVLERNPGSWLAHDNLGVLKLDSRPEEALAQMNEAARLNPDDAEIHNDRGTALQKMGHVDEAVNEYRESIRRMPNFARPHNNLGNALLALNRPEEALAASREALRLLPDFLDAHYNVGLALLTLGRPGAADEFNAALKLQPDFPEAHYYLGVLLRMQGRRDDALVQFADAVRLRPGLADAHFGLAGLLQDMGRYSDAVPEYEAAGRLQPNSPLVRNDLGVALQHLGRAGEALAQFTEAVRLNPDYSAAHSNLGAALEAAGRRTEAAVQYREVLRLNPESQQARDNLARVGGR